LAAEDILLEGSHGDIAMWPSNRGEVAPDASLGDTAVEYLLGDVAAVLSLVAGSEVRRGVMFVMVSFCSNGLVTARRTRTGHRPKEHQKLLIFEKDLQDCEDACHGY
jgi:hypothetical protein